MPFESHVLPRLRAVCVCTSVPVALALVMCLFIAGCGSAARHSVTSPAAVPVNGSVHGGQQPITGAAIQLYAVGASGDGSAATPLISTTITTSDGTGATNSNANAGNANNTLAAGYFTITGAYTCPSASTQVYLVATGGNPGLSGSASNPQIALMAALGNCGDLSASTAVQINELTTIATMAPLYSFMGSYSAVGAATANASQLTTDFGTVNQYADVSAGTVQGPALPTGYYASSTEIKTLADVVAACVNSSGGTAGDSTACGQLFQLTTPSSGPAPTDTVQAILNILKNPSVNTAAIFNLMTASGPFQPTLAAAPQAWALPITPDGTAAKLAFTTQPTNSVATGTLSPVMVTIEDGNGNPVTTATGSVSVALGSNPGATTLGGTLTVNAVNGVATFSDLSIGKAASGYTLTASMPTLASAASSSFNIVAGAASTLRFSQAPAQFGSSGAINTFRVEIDDALGNRTSSNASVSVALGTNPTGATLSGSSTQTAIAGQASFSGMSVNYPATGYTVVANSAGLTSATSTFNVVGVIGLSTASDELGHAGPLSIPLSIAAPPGGVTFTLTSDNPAVMAVPSTVFVPGGSTVLTTATSVVAAHIGTAHITVSGPDYSTATGSVTVSTRITVNSYNIAVYQSLLANTTISISGIAPSDGLTLNLAVADPTIATVPATVTIPSGASSVPLIVTGAGVGNTTLQVTYPANPSGSALITVYATPPVTVTSNDYLSGNVVIGNNLYATLGLTVPAGPPSDETITIRSGDPAHFLLTTDATQVGSASVSLTLPRNTTTLPNIYLQGQNYSGNTTISALLTLSAPDYKTNTIGMFLYPSGLVFNGNGTLTTTNISAPSAIPAYLLPMFPGTLQVQQFPYEYLGPQAAPISYTVASSNPAAGTITGSPATIPVGSWVSTPAPTFDPVAVGTSTISLVQPAGYYAGSEPTLWSQQVTATVAQAAITMASPVIGNNSYSSLALSLLGRPPQNETMTVTSSDPTHFLLTTDPTVAGTASVTVQLTQNDPYVPPVYVQAQNFSGSAAITGTITATAANYTAGVGTPAVYPTGLGFMEVPITGSASSVAVRLAPTLFILNPATLAYMYPANYVSPQAGPITFNITSSNVAVGTILNSPATIPVGYGGVPLSNYPAFQPVGDGTATITIQQPAGYVSPTGYYTDQLTATITN